MSDVYITIKCKNCGKKHEIKNPEKPKRYRCGNCKHPVIVEPRLLGGYEEKSKNKTEKIKKPRKKIQYLLYPIIFLALAFIVAQVLIILSNSFSKSSHKQEKKIPSVVSELREEKKITSVTPKLKENLNSDKNGEKRQISKRVKIDWDALAKQIITDYRGDIISIPQLNSSTCWVSIPATLSNYRAIQIAENVGYYISSVTATKKGVKVWKGDKPSVHVFKGTTHIAVARPTLSGMNYVGKLDIKKW